jgi:hypothetical protein
MAQKRERAVFRTAFPLPLCETPRSFAKTGSGQTRGKLNKKRKRAGRFSHHDRSDCGGRGRRDFGLCETKRTFTFNIPPFFRSLYRNEIFLPRQARDKRRDSTQKDYRLQYSLRFSQACLGKQTIVFTVFEYCYDQNKRAVFSRTKQTGRFLSHLLCAPELCAVCGVVDARGDTVGGCRFGDDVRKHSDHPGGVGDNGRRV